jgi:hypothetical protein
MSWLSERWGNGPSMGGLKSSIKGTVKTIGKVAPYVAGAALIPGVGGMLGGALGGIASKIPGGGLISGGGADGKGNFGALGDLAGKVGGKLPAVGQLAGALGGKDGFGLDDLLQLGIGGMSAYEGIKGSQESDKLRREALEMAKQDHAARGQFRQMATPMLQAQRPDLSQTFAGYSNPYRKIPAVGGRS